MNIFRRVTESIVLDERHVPHCAGLQRCQAVYHCFAGLWVRHHCYDFMYVIPGLSKGFQFWQMT